MSAALESVLRAGYGVKNPRDLADAIDRLIKEAHRLGSEMPVRSYRGFTLDTYTSLLMILADPRSESAA